MKNLFLCSLVLCLFMAGCAGSSKFGDENRISYMNADLLHLKSLSSENKEIDELLDKANNISKMNERCGSISLNEVLDSTCERFYAIELPEFERSYSRVTGDIRMGRVQLENSLKNRLGKIEACADALKVFYVPIEQLIKTNVNIVDYVPLNMDGSEFKVNYELSVEYDKDVLKWMQKNAERWGEQCEASVFDGQDHQFIKIFIEQVERVNEEMRSSGADVMVRHKINWESNTLRRIDESLSFFLKHRTNWWLTNPSISYYINGSKVEDFYIVREDNWNTFLEIRPELYGRRGTTQSFAISKSGKKVFSGEFPKDGVKGRWAWDH